MFKSPALKAECRTRTCVNRATHGSVEKNERGRSELGMMENTGSITQTLDLGGGERRNGGGLAFRYPPITSQQSKQQYMPQGWDENAFWGLDFLKTGTAHGQIGSMGWEGWRPKATGGAYFDDDSESCFYYSLDIMACCVSQHAWVILAMEVAAAA